MDDDPRRRRMGFRAWCTGEVIYGLRLPEGGRVPRIEVEGAGMFDGEEGKRLVLAIEEDAGVDILHDVGPRPEN
jgi:hypothetical protein